jgi:predicted DNA-binding protein YlxM (UPF0122 family)
MKKLTAHQIKRINAIASNKLTAREIAEKVRANRDSVYAYMKRNNIEFKLRTMTPGTVKPENFNSKIFTWELAKRLDFAYS